MGDESTVNVCCFVFCLAQLKVKTTAFMFCVCYFARYKAMHSWLIMSNIRINFLANTFEPYTRIPACCAHLLRWSSRAPASELCECAGVAGVTKTLFYSLRPPWGSQGSACAGWCPLCTPTHNECGWSQPPLQRGERRLAHSSSL